ncbi:homocysteine S-methyltransferase YbgG-like [Symsagittifera roscoffensis]|uniref:homocysteine S-methyltransferase YbgG-like n=1 Tax=Symsagittifera roscoffensis TaxID=84072 RepID=UPI00307B4162
MDEIELFDGSVGMYTRSLLTEEEKEREDPLWGSGLIVTRPDIVQQMHREYVSAGSTFITTCTYQTSLDLYCSEFNITREEAQQKLANSVNLARTCLNSNGEQGDKKRFKVAASIGSFGAHLCNMSEYNGSFAANFSEEQMASWHKELVSAFQLTKPDVIGFETIPVIKEMNAIMCMMRDCFPSQKFYLSFQCSSPSTLGSGQSFQLAIQQLLTFKANNNLVAIGINCSAVQHTTGLLESARDAISQLALPVLIMPNLKFGGFAAEEFEQLRKDFFDCIESQCVQWHALGVRWFGLCCRTEPPDISKLKLIITSKLGNSCSSQANKNSI